MNIEYLLKILNNRLAYLGPLRTSAEQAGDLEQIDRLDKEIAEVNLTINQLKSIG